ncbi:phosphomannomutase/phosphoglucomutase [Desulfosporosinus sp. BICA1-9]|uniref:phosphomannomutase/phosphoglucomutase n=1 Tax=Desulfosporosinus sp. BICA1-9 TaxID=1531958 RepID=UPI00054BC4B1|nr:phosphomannomutase/phosphoglucomutase [Desulfosporosinus sp. BICA1-9]KJS47216.1 MAG: phosphomannomutase [Peptococcaceae bacterium BRH_c23]KJS84880.1 MAG: phosphomannomutase [Desulfosporosinus sp. BICA1-9]HBW37496.1 phosphomannomutase/phosphoglucomutase [Desulfosporosinus sp.]
MFSDNFKSMFREYDIRGRVSEEELNDESVALITKAFSTFLDRASINRVVVGYDNRSYSERFAEVAINTFVKMGFEVFDVGLSLSPVAYFAQYHLKSPGVMMITASHNPNGWSGFKLGHGYSKTIGPDEVKELYKIIESQDFTSKEKPGTRSEVSVRDAYIEAITSRIHIESDYAPRVVIDAGNGGAGLFAYEVFQDIGCTTFQLNCDPDTSYPHYFPNPSDLVGRKRLAEMVLHPYIKADIGISFDGDGDRIGVVDQNGENIWSDKILIILARQLLERKKGAKIVFDVKCTQGLIDDITKRGGIPIMWKTGHSYIKAKMHSEEAELAGERSGHIFMGDDYYGFDDAIFAAAKLVEYISHVKKSLSEIVEDLPQYFTSPEIKAHCADTVKYKVIEQVVSDFKKEYGDNVIDINGARVVFADGWGLVRASSNLPELVLIFEAKTKERLFEIRQIFKEKLSQFKEVDPEWQNDLED